MSNKKTNTNFSLVGFEDIFNVGTTDSPTEHVKMIALCELYPPEFHPFQVNDDAAMQSLAMSVKLNGVRDLD